MTEALQEKILDGIEQLASATNRQDKAGREHAVAEHAYRQLRANEFVRVSLDKDDAGKKLTDTHKNALVDIKSDNAMLRVRLAEAESKAADELVRSLRTQISALQSLINAQRAEAEMVTYKQTAGA
jgi:hypothetical protein